MSSVLTPLPDPSPHWHAPTKFRTRQAYVKQVLQSIYRGNCCRVLGPRFRYKSDVLRAAVDTLRSHDYYHVIYLPMSDVAASSEAFFFRSIMTRVMDSFTGGYLPPSPMPIEEVQNALDFQHALLHLAARSRKNLVLFADSLEMIPPNLGALLVGVLRTVFLLRADAPGARFQAVVAGSLSLSQVALENASGFESVADLVLVGDLDGSERELLVRGICLDKGIEPKRAAVDYLLSRTGGDPFLIEEVLELACRQILTRSKRRLTPADVKVAEAQFLNKEPYRILLTELRHIETDPDLLTACLIMLERGTVPGNELPSDIERSPSAVELCGAFEAVGEGFRIKPGIWLNVIRRHFKPSHIGERYFIIGDWARAMDYLGRAVASGGYEVRVELYATVINAINASASLKQSFEYLLDGLEALYAANDPCVYTVQGYELHPVRHKIPVISMHEIGRPEIVALEGPKYSINTVNGKSQLLVPLRVGNRGARPLGLITLNALSGSSLYEQRDETLQLVSFLQQASRAIFSRMGLERTERGSEQLRALNGVLTTMLHRHSTTVHTLLRVALEGVTHGWGLGFNRAVLFEPDAGGKALVGTMGIGHLSREATEAEWKEFPYDRQPLDEWLRTLFDDHQEKEKHKELEQQIKRIAVPLHRDNLDQLARSFLDRRPFFGNHSAALRALSRNVLESLRPSIPFAIVPFHTREEVLGVLYVDDKFAPSSHSAERFQLLQSFATQTSLIIENAKAIAKAQLQTRNVQELRQQHFIMTSGLVHELRTSMSGVQDLLTEVRSLALHGQSVEEPLADLAIKARIIDELTDRVQAFHIPPFNPNPHRLSSVINQALDAVEPTRPAHVRVDYSPVEDDPLIIIDKNWIELLLRNLLQNAFEALAADRPGFVRVELSVPMDMVSVRISDNGPGIAADIINRVFEPGISTKRQGQPLFRGMGLYYCHQVAQEHHGSLEVESEQGQGAVFTLQLPLQKHGALIT